MTLPIYKIMVYHGANLLHTIEHDANVVRVSDCLTGEVGTFSFTLPTSKAPSSYSYTNIALFDTVKIWLGYIETGGLATDPDMVGRIFHISSPVQTGNGYVRIYSGMNQGEVMQRNLDTKYWTDTHADVIVAELAADLGLGTSFSGDASDDYHVTLHMEDQKYWDIVKDISDYWVSAGVQISKDFYVDIGDVGHPTGHLVWKTRPLRTVGVETLTERNMKSFSVVKNLSQVFNAFFVYGELGKIGVVGAEGRCVPTDMDTWTYDGKTAGLWIEVLGVVDSDVGHVKVGANCLECLSTDPAHEAEFRRNITVPMLGKEKYQSLNFYIRKEFGGTDNIDVRLYAPDASNYFWTTVSMTSTHVFHQYELGQNNEYDVDKRPTGTWHKVGSPLWYYLPTIWFKGTFVSQERIWLDSLYFGHGRFRATVSDPTSITDYGVRELVVVDDALHSDAECTCRGNMLLSKMKDPSTQLEFTTALNTNVKIGDRLAITLPSENISAVNFDVLNVEHTFVAGAEGALTKAVLNSNERQREKVPNSPIEVLKKLSNEVRNLVKAGEKVYAPI